jgi:phage-related minor tail protein
LDKLAKAGQLTGVNVGNLTNQLQQNQAALSALGLSLDDSIALLSNFEAQGIEAGDALAAMKIGVNNLVDQGLTPADAIEKIVDSIKNAKTETEAIEIAANTFGKRGGLAMFNAIKNGTFDIEKMKAALEDADGTVEDTYKNMETF